MPDWPCHLSTSCLSLDIDPNPSCLLLVSHEPHTLRTSYVAAVLVAPSQVWSLRAWIFRLGASKESMRRACHDGAPKNWLPHPDQHPSTIGSTHSAHCPPFSVARSQSASPRPPACNLFPGTTRSAPSELCRRLNLESIIIPDLTILSAILGTDRNLHTQRVCRIGASPSSSHTTPPRIASHSQHLLRPAGRLATARCPES